jgi:hypothetical protein
MESFANNVETPSSPHLNNAEFVVRQTKREAFAPTVETV